MCADLKIQNMETDDSLWWLNFSDSDELRYLRSTEMATTPMWCEAGKLLCNNYKLERQVNTVKMFIPADDENARLCRKVLWSGSVCPECQPVRRISLWIPGAGGGWRVCGTWQRHEQREGRDGQRDIFTEGPQPHDRLTMKGDQQTTSDNDSRKLGASVREEWMTGCYESDSSGLSVPKSTASVCYFSAVHIVFTSPEETLPEPNLDLNCRSIVVLGKRISPPSETTVMWLLP